MSDQQDVLEGTIDSIRDQIAVILVGDEETEHTLPTDELPDGAREGSRVEVRFDGDMVVALAVIEAEPSTEDLVDRMSRLKSERPSGLLGRTNTEHS